VLQNEKREGRKEKERRRKGAELPAKHSLTLFLSPVVNVCYCCHFNSSPPQQVCLLDLFHGHV
jgi:hypothetical protein